MMDTKRKIQTVFISLFLLSLCVPTLYIIIKNDDITNQFKNDFSLESVDSLMANYNQTYPLKSEFVDFNAHLKNAFFNSSPQPHKALIGTSGWLFYNTKSDKIVDSYRRTNILSNDSLQTIINLWNSRRQTIEKDSNKLVIAIWPNKSSMYREYLPLSMENQIQNSPSKINQFLNSISNDSLSRITVDIRPIFEANKPSKQLYQKQDTHWNEDGAYLAYVEIVKKLNIESYKKSDFHIIYNESTKADLIDQSGFLSQTKYSDIKPSYTLIDTSIRITHQQGTWSGSEIYTNHTVDNDLKAVIFGDSYTQALIPFLSLHFKELNFEWAPYSDRYVQNQKPDIVIESRVERYW